MRIIKRGQLPEDKIYKGTCSHCKTIFECQRHEGQYVSAQRDGDFIKVNCPVCGKQAFAYEHNDGQQIPLSQRRYVWGEDYSIGGDGRI